MFVQSAVLRAVMVSACFAQVLSTVSRPNIVIVLADDLGWNDVSFHGSDQIQTPNIDALAYNGIILNSHYVPALCTPSRSSLLTGKYPTSLGMQHLVILAPEPWGLPLNETLMPQHLKRHGYATHAIGKWHLGFHEKEYTPTYRGFDTHFGYWNGFQDYFDHTMQFQSMKGYDMRRGMAVDLSSKGKYSTDVFTEEAVNIIRQHNSTRGPLFLYLSHLAPHAGNPEEPFKAPEEEMAKHAHIADPERRAYAAMVSKLDESLGRVMAGLEEKDMLDNSIILFMTDNGAVTFGLHSNRGSNHPLRGLKESPWEGGVRGVAAIWSPLLKSTRRVSDQLMHMSDWLPTLYSAAGLDPSELGAIDGKDMWNVLSQNLDSPRTEVFNNYDEIDDYSSFMMGSWKYVAGTTQGGEVDGWYGESGEDEDSEYDVSRVLESPTNLAISSCLREAVVGASAGVTGPEPISPETMLELRRGSVIACEYPTFWSFVSTSDNHAESCTQEEISKEDGEEIIWELEKIYEKHPPKGNPGRFAFSPLERIRVENLIEAGQLRQAFGCDPLKSACLFNLAEDPCERINLAKIFPGIVKILEKRLDELKKEVVRPINQPIDPFSNPALYNDTWTTWCDVKRENDPKMLAKAIVDSVASALRVDRLLTPLAETFVLKSLRDTFSPVAHVLESFLWLAILLVTAITVLYAVAALKRLVPSQGGDSARKKSWAQWENLTFRPFTDPEGRNVKAGDGR